MRSRKPRLLVLALILLASAAVVARHWWRTRPAAIPAARLRAAVPKAGAMPVEFDAPPFAFVDQDNRPISSRSLRGKVWVADFIFTRCGNTCPIMTSKMVALQKQITDPIVLFVSFSVDPDRDKPADLKAYAQKYSVDESRWHFLSPPDAKSVMGVAAGMKIAGPPTETNNPSSTPTAFC